MIKQLILVALGGAGGSVLRYLISLFTSKWYEGGFPIATFGVNLLGCFLIGLLVGLFPANSQLKLLLVVGFCGGFTTFSTFSNEALSLIQGQQILLAISYILASCILGVLAVWIGLQITR